MDEKDETVAAYDAYAEIFDIEYESHMRRYNLAHADAFVSELAGKSILDVGAGPGNHAAYFAEKGLDVLCADLSEKMVALCRRKGLVAIPLDLENFEIARRFDGIWANACLLHLRKADIPGVIDRLARHLAPAGVLGCAVKEGEGERIESDPAYLGTRRRFSYFSDEEFRGLLAPRFDVIRHETAPTRTRRTVFLKYLCRLRAP